MTIFDYINFLTVAECKSITVAADKLCLTKSAVSHNISKIEKELSVPLFFRGNNNWLLTDAGKMLLPYAQEVIRADQRFNETVRALNGLSSGCVKLGTCSSTCINWIPGIIKSFREKHPGVTVEVISGFCNTQLISMLRKNELDLAIAAATDEADLEISEIFVDEMMCVTSADFEPQNHTYVVSDDLRSLTNMISMGDYGEEALLVANHMGITACSTYTSVDDASLVALAESGLGFCIMGRLVLKSLSANIRAYSFNPPQYRHLSVLRNNRMEPSAATKALRDLIISYVRELPPFELPFQVASPASNPQE